MLLREPLAARLGSVYPRMMRAFLLAGFLVAVMAVAAIPARAAQDDPRLNALFDKLKTTDSDEEAKAAELQIWQIWSENKNPEIARLMQHGIAAMGEDDEEGALDAFTEVVKND